MMKAMFKLNDITYNFISFLICVTTWSKCSHAELCFSNGTVLTADPADGVHFVDGIKDRKYNPYYWSAVPLPWISPYEEDKILNHARTLIGREYDYMGAILGGLFACQESEKYFCSELVTDLLWQYTPGLNPMKWISPNGLWKFLSNFLYENYPEYNPITNPSTVKSDK